MNLPPYYIEIPFDTLGNWVDTVLARWDEFDCSRKVKDLPGSEELAWFLGCGTTDYMCTYPTYQVFMDSLDTYGINYDYRFFEGGHELNTDTWMAGMHWMDSIINYSYQTLGIEPIHYQSATFNVFPNPTQDQLKIVCQLKAATVLKIEIINLMGRQMELVTQKRKQAGEFIAELDIAHYPPGIYFCRIQIGNETITKKIVKVK
jgi:hypothetical protein